MTESIDITTAGGRLVFDLFGGLAEFERQPIRDRPSPLWRRRGPGAGSGGGRGR